MSWTYSYSDIAAVGTLPQAPEPVAAPQTDLALLQQRAGALGALVPAAFANFLNDPSRDQESKRAALADLVRYGDGPISAADVANAPDAVKEVVAALKQRQDEVAAQEQQVAAPVAAVTASLAAPVAELPSPMAAIAQYSGGDLRTDFSAPQPQWAGLEYALEQGPPSTPNVTGGRGQGQGLV